uniref:ELKS/RAB6-interacting/CAST family member 2 n=2 Tax=Steinernema glaseri TaxID=37863 RepID=A0A1I8APR2_9BILA
MYCCVLFEAQALPAAGDKLHQMMHKKDEMVQTGPAEVDPSLWTGNQRVLHFGPMAQRDPYFYYYPKGWDILYPAHFGFFPYRTTKYRGSSALICIWGFGFFLMLGGLLMIYLGFFVLYDTPFWLWPEQKLAFVPPIQIAGPVLLCAGLLLVFVGCLCSLANSQQPTAVYEKCPYQPLPPPAYPVLENKYAHSAMLNPQSEMKLYPPVMPGYSTLSLHGRSPSVFMASPYNTLRAMSVNRYHPSNIDVGGGEQPTRTGSIAAGTGMTSGRRRSSDSLSHRRAKSMGPLQRAPSRRFRDRENSQV